MDFDDIMVKYLDGSISVSENETLNVMIADNPALKEEYMQLTALEKQLESSKTVLNDSDIAFLTAYGDNLFQSPSAPGNVSGVIKKASFFSSKLNIILSSASVILTAGIVAYFLLCNPSLKNSNNAGTIVTNQNAPVIEQNSSNQPVVDSQKVQYATSDNANIEKSDNYDNKSVTEKRESDVNAQINQSSTLKNQDLITKIQAELKGYEAQNDLQNQILSLKKLAILFRDGENMMNESRVALDNALVLAATSKNPELVAEIYGEMGLLNKKTGDKVQAIAYIEKCLELLKDSNSGRSKHWQKQLDKLKM